MTQNTPFLIVEEVPSDCFAAVFFRNLPLTHSDTMGGAVGIGRITLQKDEPTPYRQTGAAGVTKFHYSALRGGAESGINLALMRGKGAQDFALFSRRHMEIIKGTRQLSRDLIKFLG